jgi:hypothetical protein
MTNSVSGMRPTSPALPRFLWTTRLPAGNDLRRLLQNSYEQYQSLLGTLAAFKALPQFRQGVPMRDRFTTRIAMRHLQKQSGKIFDQL